MHVCARREVAAAGVVLAAVLGVGETAVAQEETPDVTDEQAAAVVGTWLGTLRFGGTDLRIVFHVERGEEGGLEATMDSPDQGARGIPVAGVRLEGDSVAFDVTVAQGRYDGRLSSDADSIHGTWSQGGMEIPLDLGKVDEVEEPNRPQTPQPPFPYRVEEVRYPNPAAGIELAGTLTLPGGDGPFPAVVLVSGSGAQDRDETIFQHRPFFVLADHLTRRGIAVLRFDDRGVGESGGSFSGATTEDFVADALAGIRYLRGRPEVDEARVGIAGHSEGGLVGPLAATRSDDVAFVVMIAGPGLPGEEILYLQGAALARAAGASEEDVAESRALQERLFRVLREHPDSALAAGHLRRVMEVRMAGMSEEEREEAGLTEEGADAAIEAQVRQLTSAWFRFFLGHDPADVLDDVDVPVLAVIGEKDLQVPPDENLPAIEAALEEGGNPDHTVLELEGLNHLLQHAETGAVTEYGRIEETMAPEAMELIADWIVERFGERFGG